jgi:hypothetical protein
MFKPSKQLHSQLSLHLHAILAAHWMTTEARKPVMKSKHIMYICMDI